MADINIFLPVTCELALFKYRVPVKRKIANEDFYRGLATIGLHKSCREKNRLVTKVYRSYGQFDLLIYIIDCHLLLVCDMSSLMCPVPPRTHNIY